MPYANPEDKKKNEALRFDYKKFKEELIPMAEEFDAKGERYLSEALSMRDLVDLFLGDKTISQDTEEEDEARGKKTRRAAVMPKPYRSKVFGNRIQFIEWLAFRDRCRKDLFWLGQTVLKHDLIETTHGIICKQFVQKNFDGVFKPGYTIGDVHRAINKQERFDDEGRSTKDLVLLDSRGHFKSTINRMDCLQWLLACSDIRILILTGEYKLAVAFLKMIKGYFYLPEGGEPTDLHLLFPEYIVRGVKGTSKEPLLCPARSITQTEPSLWVNSIDSNLSGWHCDVKKSDDVVTDNNCNTRDTRDALKEKFDGTGNLLDEWGFADNIGTRYYNDDWYGKKLESISEDNPVKYFCRACWQVKPEFNEVPLKQLTEEMVILTFPEKSTFKSLRKKLLENERSFRNQQLNEPSGEENHGFKISFDRDVLRSHSYQAAAAPKIGDLFICWDTALSAGKTSDYSCGIVGRVYKKEDGKFGIVILEVICDRWKQSELAYQVVALNKRWNPKRTLIETLNGSELFKLEVMRLARQYATTLDIWWKPPSTAPDAKRNRIKGLETLLNDDRLYFVLGPWLDDTFDQLCKYTGERKNRGRKDDIPDAMSYLTFFLPYGSVDVLKKDTEELAQIQEAAAKEAQRTAQYDRIFGDGSMPQPPRTDAPVVQQQDPRRAAMNRIFGGNGMRA